MSEGNNIFEASGLSSLLGSESEQDFQYLDPNDIEPDPNQPRKIGVDDVSDIRKTLKSERQREMGITNAIAVRELGNGKYRLINGERRWRASILEKLPRIPARIINEEDVVELVYFQLADNQMQKPMDPRDQGATFLRLKEQGQSASQIANRTFDLNSENNKIESLSNEVVGQYMNIARANENEATKYIADLLDEPSPGDFHTKPVRDLKLLSSLARTALKNERHGAKVKFLISALLKSDRLNRDSASSLKKLDFDKDVDVLKNELFESTSKRVSALEKNAKKAPETEEKINGASEISSIGHDAEKHGDETLAEVIGANKEHSDDDKLLANTNNSDMSENRRVKKEFVEVVVTIKSTEYVLLSKSQPKTAGSIVVEDPVGSKQEYPLDSVEHVHLRLSGDAKGAKS